MTRDIPLRERKPKRVVEDDAQRRALTQARFSPPVEATAAFKDGYRECIALYALHAPNKRGVGKILDDHRILVEEECLRAKMDRASLARYEGFRQAIKDLRATRAIR